MGQPTILVCEFFDDEALSYAPKDITVSYEPQLAEDRARLLSALTTAHGLVVRNRTVVDAELLDAAPRLCVVGRVGVGLENFDLAACRARNVAVKPATGANAVSVAEYVIAATLRLVRGDLVANAPIVSGAWPRRAMIAGEVYGMTMGIFGLGSTGAATAVRARALGMRVIASDPYLDDGAPAWDGVEPASPENVLAAADVLSLHTPLTEETRHLIDAEALERMKPGAILINAARGPVVDAAAVIAALRDGRLGGAAIDVYDREPVTVEDGHLFDGAPNLILTPHIAGVTRESNRRVSIMAIEQTVAEIKRRGL